MKAIILLGAPGAGKGTIAVSLAGKGRYEHLSTGDILRAAVAENTSVGRKAKPFMDAGDLVPDDLVVELVAETVRQEDEVCWYVFDGFPRTLEQARRLDEQLELNDGSLERVFQVDVPVEVLVRRLAGRRVCSACSAVYHVDNRPPADEGVCDRCGGELVQREDDNEETVRNRLEQYKIQSEPLTGYYRQRGLLEVLDGQKDPESIADDIASCLSAGVVDR